MARRRDDDDEVEQPKPQAKETPRPNAKFDFSPQASLAEGGGLFASGPAKLEACAIAPFDYNGTRTNPTPIVFLARYSRGTGKEKEQHEQPYTCGDGWAFKKNGELENTLGYNRFPPRCNATRYFTQALFDACKAQDIPFPDWNDFDSLVGSEFLLERVVQPEWDGGDKKGKRNFTPHDESKGPRTILTIKEVISAAWVKGGGKVKAKAKDEDDEPEAEEDDQDDASDDLTEEAVEAINAVIEAGKVKLGDELEEKLEHHLRKRKDAAQIIDLATSDKFLKKKGMGWVLTGKYIDTEE